MKNKLIFLFVMIILLIGCQPNLEIIPGTQVQQMIKTEITSEVSMKYLLYVPEQYELNKKKWPLLFFLHGAGERGDDLEKVKVHGPPKLVEKGESFPFIIVSPQCSENSYWPQEVDVLEKLLDDIITKLSVDESRIYLTGLSMGGYGTWNWAIHYPERFAAIAPICGGGDDRRAEKIKHIPTWVFHGAKDETVPLEQSQKMVAALEKVNGNVKFTVYPDAEHDSWTETYNNPEFYDWILSHKKK